MQTCKDVKNTIWTSVMLNVFLGIPLSIASFCVRMVNGTLPIRVNKVSIQRVKFIFMHKQC